jgi:RNA recognition motif-containing protein
MKAWQSSSRSSVK